jgi:nicotinamide riboside transporter PnuC
MLFVGAALAIVGNAIYAAVKDPHQFTHLLAAILLMLLGLPGYFFWNRAKGRRTRLNGTR